MGINYVDDFSFLKKACFSPDGKWQKVSASFCDYLGYKEKELLSLKLSYVSHPEDISKCLRLLSSTDEIPHEFEIRFIHKSGKILWAKIKTMIARDMLGVPDLIAVYATDITQYKNSQPQLEQQLDWIQQFLNWHHLVEENPLPVLISIDGIIEFVNKSGLKLLDTRSETKVLGKSLFDFLDPESAEKMQKKIESLDEEKVRTPLEQHLVKPNGEKAIVEAYLTPVTYDGHTAVQTVLRDITDAKKREEEIIRELGRRKILLQEIHHRVKNNLAMISGLLELQAMHTEDDSVLTIIRDGQLRIQSMAIIHEKLYKSSNLSEIDFDNYTRELVETIIDSYHIEHKDITVQYDLDNFKLDIIKAVPAALVLNELVSNCYKHAFDKMDKGLVGISIKKIGNEIMMSVSDNGVGITDDFSIEHQQSLGMKLIKTLSKQLEGEITYESIDGTTFTLNFPLGESI